VARGAGVAQVVVAAQGLERRVVLELAGRLVEYGERRIEVAVLGPLLGLGPDPGQRLGDATLRGRAGGAAVAAQAARVVAVALALLTAVLEHARGLALLPRVVADRLDQERLDFGERAVLVPQHQHG